MITIILTWDFMYSSGQTTHHAIVAATPDNKNGPTTLVENKWGAWRLAESTWGQEG